jgi:hypothetical protein
MTNSNARGSTTDRRNRRLWLLSPESGFGGNGQRVKCATCPKVLTYETLTVDRYPIMGCDGGTYKRNNIRPQCLQCNCGHGARIGHERRRFQKLVQERRRRKRIEQQRKDARKVRKGKAA